MALQIYILHFTPPYKHARHYTGISKEANLRVERHIRGTTKVRLVNVIHEQGHSISVGNMFSVPNKLSEKALKKGKSVPDYCSICNPKGYVEATRRFRAREYKKDSAHRRAANGNKKKETATADTN